MNKQEYKAGASLLEPVINVGKSGIEKIVEELKKQLKNKNIDVRGNTAVFRRKE